MPDIQTAITDNVDTFGWHAQSVLGDKDWPRFMYSIGWGVKRDWPELLVVGQRPEVAHGMLTRFWQTDVAPVKDATRSDILNGFVCHLKAVDLSWYRFLFGAAMDYYMERSLPPFRALQCVWPTTRGVLPWDANAPEGFDIAQPLTNIAMANEPGS